MMMTKELRIATVVGIAQSRLAVRNKVVNIRFEIYITRKYPLRGYILGVLTHTTAWDGHCMKVRFAHFSSGVYVPAAALSYVASKE